MKTVVAVNNEIFFDVMRLWGLELKHIHKDVFMAGSPDRCECRCVVESTKGDRFVLEQVFESTVVRKKEIAGYLDHLSSVGLETIIPYRKNRKGEHVLRCGGRFWQIQDFFPGVELDRERYVFDGWRGKASADFLIDLKQCSQGLDNGRQASFSLKAYIYHFVRDVRRHDPVYEKEIMKAVDFLNGDFFLVSDHLPNAFCHGDYHPLNIIWTPLGIGSVIDWEFCGWKSELYDAANMVGCLGIEDPEALVGDYVLRFIDMLRNCSIYQRESWRYFYELILAVRFGWMAEWLRKKDREMVKMELDYWNILMDHKRNLRTAWGI